MTISQVEEAARNKYNAINDTFYSASEIRGYMYQACLEMATETHCIQSTFTTTTVASTQEYAWPTNAISIKRITVNGQKLIPITFRDDDSLTLSNSTTTTTGAPQYYTQWDQVFALRPIPSDAWTMKVYAVVEPAALTDTSVLEIPTAFHNVIVDYCASEMAAKDQNYEASKHYSDKYDRGVVRLKRHMKKIIRGDAFGAVQDEDSLPSTILGAV